MTINEIIFMREMMNFITSLPQNFDYQNNLKFEKLINHSLIIFRIVMPTYFDATFRLRQDAGIICEYYELRPNPYNITELYSCIEFVDKLTALSHVINEVLNNG